MTERFEEYHRWYYDNLVYTRTRFLGVPVLKHVADLWSYQELIHELRPSLIVEMGTEAGGGALYFAEVVKAARLDWVVLSVDVDHGQTDERVRSHPRIELLTARSVDPAVEQRIAQIRTLLRGPMLVSLDSDHRKENVLAELMFFRALTRSGDYVVVEDGNVNGHPVLPSFGPGPYEAIQEYMTRFPGDYEPDVKREEKFGLTFAPGGWLRRC